MFRKYPDELRAEVVNAVLDGGMTYAGAARRFGLVDETVRNWVTAATKNPDDPLRVSDATIQERIAALERRLGELQQYDVRAERAAMVVVKGLATALKPWLAALLHDTTPTDMSMQEGGSDG